MKIVNYSILMITSDLKSEEKEIHHTVKNQNQFNVIDMRY